MSLGLAGVRTLIRTGLMMAALVAAGALPLSASAQVLTPTRFSLVVDGVEVGSFAAVTGINTASGPVDLTAATELKKLPGKRKPPTLTLKRGKSSSASLLELAAVRPGGDAVVRKSATLVTYSTDGTPVARYHLENAWPSSVQVLGVDASKNEVSIETVELVADSIQLL